MSFEFVILGLKFGDGFPEGLILLFDCSDLSFVVCKNVGIVFFECMIFLFKILNEEFELILVFGMLSEWGLTGLEEGLELGVLL